ncbi:hypothetical protein M8J77_002051 [Diaphorina citri]|nr:hypothetical protein M8J77_002051 [Diaphorina citri]
MILALIIALLAVGLVPPGVTSDEVNASTHFINGRGNDINKRETGRPSRSNVINELNGLGNAFNISQINRITKSFSNSKEAWNGNKEINKRHNNTQVQVHMEQLGGNRINKRKTNGASMPPMVLSDLANILEQTNYGPRNYVPQNIQNLYNGDQYNSNYNYRLANQQTLGGNGQGNNRFGKNYASNYIRNNNYFKTNNENWNSEKANKPAETLNNVGQDRVNDFNKNVNNVNSNGQNQLQTENKRTNQNVDRKSVQSNGQYNPYSAYRTFNKQQSANNVTYQIPSYSNGYNGYNTIAYSSNGSTNSVDTQQTNTLNQYGNKTPTNVNNIAQIYQNNKRNIPTNTVGVPNYNPKAENNKKIISSDNGLSKNFNQNKTRTQKSNEGDKLRINLNSGNNKNENDVNVNRNHTNTNNVVQQNSTSLGNQNSQVYAFATTMTPSHSNVQNSTSYTNPLQNYSSKNNFVPFYQFRAYNNADIKQFQPNSSSVDPFNSSVITGPVHGNNFQNRGGNNINPTNNANNYGVSQNANNPDQTTQVNSLPRNHKPDGNPIRNLIIVPDLVSNDQAIDNATVQQTQNEFQARNFNEHLPPFQSPNYKTTGNNLQQNRIGFNVPGLNQFGQHLQPFNLVNNQTTNNVNIQPNQNGFNTPSFNQYSQPLNQPNNQNSNNFNIQQNQNGFNASSFNQYSQPFHAVTPQHNQTANNANLQQNQNGFNVPSLNQYSQPPNQPNNQTASNANPHQHPNGLNAPNVKQFSQPIQPNGQPIENKYSSAVPSLDADSVIVQNNGVPSSENVTFESSNDLVVLNRTSRFLLNKPLPPTYYTVPKVPLLPLHPGPLLPSSYSVPTFTPTPSFASLPPLSYTPKSTVSSFDGFFGSVNPVTNTLVPFDVQVKDVMCYRSSNHSKFIATFLTSQFILNSPVIEDAERGVACDVTQLDSYRFQVDFNSDDTMTACGIRTCASEVDNDLLCVTIRFPVTRGLRQLTDTVVTIQCQPLPPSQSQTKQISLKPVQKAKEARNLGALLSDTKPIEMHSDLNLYRKGPSGQFTNKIIPGSSVELGEELQLKCNVRQGDGWVYSRMSDVTFHKNVPNPQSDEDTVVVVNDDGCTNPDMKTICPHEQYRDIADPLTSALVLRTFMFQGMKDGDEMVISAKITACVDPRDCTVDPSCLPNNSGWFPYLRKRRSPLHQGQNLMEDQETSVAFKIRLQTDTPCTNCVVLKTNRALSTGWLIPVFVLSTVCILSAAFVYLLVQMCKQERKYVEVWG